MWNILRKLRAKLRPDPVTRFWRSRDNVLKGNKLLLPIYEHRVHKILDRFNAVIPCREWIKPFATPHGLAGIFISYGAKIDEGCVIYHQVTIGSNTLPDSKGQGAPTIGKNVFIGAGAKIIGNVTVGDNARIGANAVVSFDVPANATVVQEAPRVILHDIPRDNTFVPWGAFSTQDAKAQ